MPSTTRSIAACVCPDREIVGPKPFDLLPSLAEMIVRDAEPLVPQLDQAAESQ